MDHDRATEQRRLAASDGATAPPRRNQASDLRHPFIAGIVLIDSPPASAAVLGGWWLVVVGVFEIVTAFRIRGHAERVPRTA
ncbi:MULTISPECIES: hypothetical protein [unclassified Streptomyces]|uniref:hypothetical protein n=1 Tax=unclassified Streptomyces TaxID=2593676 RepID=UPI0036E94E63